MGRASDPHGDLVFNNHDLNMDVLYQTDSRHMLLLQPRRGQIHIVGALPRPAQQNFSCHQSFIKNAGGPSALATEEDKDIVYVKNATVEAMSPGGTLRLLSQLLTTPHMWNLRKFIFPIKSLLVRTQSLELLCQCGYTALLYFGEVFTYSKHCVLPFQYV
ncbi:hypothetical protein K1719_008015 [Acacia pycnantha]|nr:hypothetical protein K1719_008015 [Acacia pycnantha]